MWMDQPGEIYGGYVYWKLGLNGHMGRAANHICIELRLHRSREVSKTLAVWLQLTIELLPKETGEK